jgi:Putative phage tail protein/NlpC/P60 family
MWSNKYIGIPYKQKGRDFNGIDCWGLLRLVYSEEFNINLPSFATEYTQEDIVRIQDLIAQYKEGWQQLDSPEEGCAVLFRILGTESHIGIATSSTHFLHAREKHSVVVESFESTAWKNKIVGYFKYVEKSSAVLNLIPHPLRTQRFTVAIEPGTKLSELVPWIAKEYSVPEEIRSRIVIMLNGRVTSAEEWPVTALKETDRIEYRAIPAGEKEMGMFRIVAMIIVAVAAPHIAAAIAEYAGITSVAGIAAITVGVSLVGAALVMAIAPIRPPDDVSGRDPGSSERQLMISGAANQATRYGSIPVILGKVRITPPLGAQNFISYEKERDTYLTMLLTWGYGPLVIDASTLRIGDIAISNFTLGQFSDNTTKFITLDRRTEPTSTELNRFNSIYGNDIYQVYKNLVLVCDGNPEVSTVTPGPYSEAAGNAPHNKVTVAIHFSQGLRKILVKGNEAGGSAITTVRLRYEIKLGTADWALWKTVTYGADAVKKDAFTVTETYDLNTPQEIQVRVRRETGDNQEDNPSWRYLFETQFLSATFTNNTSPAVDPKNAVIAKTALQIKANEQLSNSIEGINAIVQTYALAWNGTSWALAATNNPAALFRYVLQHPGNPQRILDADVATKINLAQLQYWYDYCVAKGFTFNRIQSQAKSVLNTLRDICAAGRASPALVDGKWTVVIDEPKSNIVQHFSPHNSWGFEGVRALPRLPDALRVTYFDEDQDYQEAEIIVYTVGKSQATAELFESIQLPGVTKSTLAIDHAKWHMAQAQLRRETYTFNTDIEYIVANRGDRVKVTHDVPMWGLGSGRVKDRITDSIFELDELVPITNGLNHTIRFRSNSGSSSERATKQQFNISTVESTGRAVTITLTAQHPLSVGNTVIVSSGVTAVNTTTAVVTAVTTTSFTYLLLGDSINLTASTGTVTLASGYYGRIQVTTAITSTDANSGDLFLFGNYQQESQDLIIMSIEPTTNKSARITLVDYGVTTSYNIFTQYLSLTANDVFQTNITRSPEYLENAFAIGDVPVITSLQSNGDAADIISPGTYSYKLRVSYANSSSRLPSNTEFVECQYDIYSSTNSSNYKSITVPFMANTVNIPNVMQGEVYKIRLRYTSSEGRVGSWTSYQSHTVAGKQSNPNNVDSAIIKRVGRYLNIIPTILDVPDDFASYEVRVFKDTGTGDFWDSTDTNIIKVKTTSIANIDLKLFPIHRISSTGIKYRIAIRTIDTVGNYSTSSYLDSIVLYTISS